MFLQFFSRVFEWICCVWYKFLQNLNSHTYQISHLVLGVNLWIWDYFYSTKVHAIYRFNGVKISSLLDWITYHQLFLRWSLWSIAKVMLTIATRATSTSATVLRHFLVNDTVIHHQCTMYRLHSNNTCENFWYHVVLPFLTPTWHHAYLISPSCSRIYDNWTITKLRWSAFEPSLDVTSFFNKLLLKGKHKLT